MNTPQMPIQSPGATGQSVPVGSAAHLHAPQLQELFAALKDKRHPPVEKWNPDHCGEIDIRIARDGTWFYLGSPIGRMPLVKLFAGVLRRESDESYVLVTPAEKLTIRVDDAPFTAVEMMVAGKGREQVISFRTNVEDVVEAGPSHPIRVTTDAATGEPAPYVHVRRRLEALIVRSVFYDLVELAEARIIDGRNVLGVWSNGVFFAIGDAP